jgi:fibronectin type 3 domain-containing protein
LSGAGVHDVALSWSGSTSTDVVGYNVYRGTSSGGESTTPLNATPITGTDYSDVNVTAGTEYYYVITAVTGDGSTQSTDSPEATATVPSP